jgi:hypothetical protein
MLILLGAGALLLARKKSSGAGSASTHDGLDGKSDDGLEDEFEDEVGLEDLMEEVIEEWEAADGSPSPGRLYQVRLGDNLLDIAAEALFGSRETRESPADRQAIIELSIRIDCAPWNQALYGRPGSDLTGGHYALESDLTHLGVSFNPIYSDNRERMLDGEKPTSEAGHDFAFIWIPMIDLYLFDENRTVSVQGMLHEDGGHNMIDPPIEVLDLGFAKVASLDVGCNLPEGDFRRTLETGP